MRSMRDASVAGEIPERAQSGRAASRKIACCAMSVSERSTSGAAREAGLGEQRGEDREGLLVLGRPQSRKQGRHRGLRVLVAESQDLLLEGCDRIAIPGLLSRRELHERRGEGTAGRSGDRARSGMVGRDGSRRASRAGERDGRS